MGLGGNMINSPWPAFVASLCAALLFAAPGLAEDPQPASDTALRAEILERNPGLKAFDERIQAASQAAPQAGAMPDPVFMVGLSNMPLSDGQTPLSGVQFELKQTLPWFGKLDAREAVALQRVEVLTALRQERANALAARGAALAWELAYLERKRALLIEIGQVLTQLEETAAITYESGQARQQDLIKPSLSKARLDDSLLDLLRREQITLSRINALRDRAPNHAFTSPTRARMLPAKLPDEVLVEFALVHNPALQAARETIETQQRALVVADRAYYPDITIGLQYRYRWVENNDPVNGTDFMGVNLAFNLPIWTANKQDAFDQQVRAGLRAAQAEQLDRTLGLRDSIQRVLSQIRSDRNSTALFEDRLIPDTHRALDSSLADYQAGRIELLSVLDNTLALLRAQDDLARRQTRIQASLAELEHLLGGSLEDALAETR
jgi:cobalt-zinc-cadmium efflux system outer membrane protein